MGLLVIGMAHLRRGEYIIKNLFSSNKREFFPGKAYLIEGKSLEQVRSKILEWLEKNEIDIVYDHDNLIEGYSIHESLIFSYDTWIYLKLIPGPKGTVVVFHHKVFKKDSRLSELREQKRLDLIRFIEGKEELDIDVSSYYTINFIFPPFVWLFSCLLFNYIVVKLLNLSVAFLWAYLVLSFVLIGYSFYYNQKRGSSLAKLPEHYVKEYDKKIDFFIGEQ